MREDRSWVVPLAFVTFGGILFAAIFAFLRLEGLLLTERGTALVAWLTLLFTVFAVVAAFTALGIALNQMKDGRIQAEIAESKELTERLQVISKISHVQMRLRDHLVVVRSLIKKLESSFMLHDLDQTDFTPDFYREFRDNYTQLLSTLSGDVHGDIYPDQDSFHRLTGTAVPAIGWYSQKLASNGLKRTDDQERASVLSGISNHMAAWREIQQFSDANRNSIQRRLDRIRENTLKRN